MNHINEEVNISQEELRELLDLGRRLKIQESKTDRGRERAELPQEILKDLEESTPSDLRSNINKYNKEIPQYEGKSWTRSGAINQVFVKDLKRHQMETYQVVQQCYKQSEKLKVAARAATEIFSELQFILERGGDSSDGEILDGALEKVRRLAVFGFASSKSVEQDAKEFSAKALKLPESVRHIADEDREDDKDLAFLSYF